MDYKIYQDLNYTMYDCVFEPMLFWFKPFKSYFEYLDILWSPYYFGLEVIHQIQSAFYNLINGELTQMAMNLWSFLFYTLATLFNLITFLVVLVTRKFKPEDDIGLMGECLLAFKLKKENLVDRIGNKAIDGWTRQLCQEIKHYYETLSRIQMLMYPNENHYMPMVHQIHMNAYGLIRGLNEFHAEVQAYSEAYGDYDDFWHQKDNHLETRYMALKNAFSNAHQLNGNIHSALMQPSAMLNNMFKFKMHLETIHDSDEIKQKIELIITNLKEIAPLLQKNNDYSRQSWMQVKVDYILIFGAIKQWNGDVQDQNLMALLESATHHHVECIADLQPGRLVLG